MARTGSRKNPSKKLLGLLCTTAILALISTGCGAKQETTIASNKAPRTVKLALDWYPNADHAAIYAGIAHNRFRQVGIKVDAKAPSDPSAPIKQVAAEQTDLAISYEPELLLARQQNLPVVAVAAIVQRPLTSIIALKHTGISSPKDLEGKHVGTAGIPYQSAYLKTILKKAGVADKSVKETSVGENLLPALLSGKVDAILGGFWNVEGIDLKLSNHAADVIPVDQAGVPNYQELVLVANENVVKDKPEWLHLFIAAMARAGDDAKRDPKLAVDALLKANKDLLAKQVRPEVKATIPAFFAAKPGRAFGFMDPLAWERYGNWMADNGLLKKRPEIAKALTNQFLLK